MRNIDSDIYVSNFWLMGFPFFYVGKLLNEYEKKFCGISLNVKMMFFLSVVSIIESSIIALLFEGRDLFVGSIFLAIVPIYISTEKAHCLKFRGGVCCMLSVAGNHLSAYIYVMHLFARDSLINTMNAYGIVLPEGMKQIVFLIIVIFFAGIIEFVINGMNSFIVQVLKSRKLLSRK